MAQFADLSDFINVSSGTDFENLFTYIDPRVAGAAAVAPVLGRFTSLWQYGKNPGGGGAIPGAAAVPVNTTNGALFQSNPGGGRQKWLTYFSPMFNTEGALLLYDRLLHCGGLSGTVTTAQTVGGTLTRNTGGVGNQILLEIYTQIGTTATTATLSYTNQGGVAGRTTPAVGIGGTGLREAQRGILVPLQDGDTGVQSVQSVTLAGTTGTAGNFGVTILKPFVTTGVGVGVNTPRDLISGQPSLIEIPTNACLAFLLFAMGTTVPSGFVQLYSAEK